MSQSKVCETCGRDPSNGEKHKAVVDMPSVEQMEEMSNMGYCTATDGCEVEPDGRCEHGHQSWMLRLGYI